MALNKYEIKGDLGGGARFITSPALENNPLLEDRSIANSKVGNVAVGLMVADTFKRSINIASSKFGDYTGDTIGQARFDALSSIASNFLLIGLNPAIGISKVGFDLVNAGTSRFIEVRNDRKVSESRLQETGNYQYLASRNGGVIIG